MNESTKNLFVLKQLIRITQKEAMYLVRTAERIKQQSPDIDWVGSLEHSDDHVQGIVLN